MVLQGRYPVEAETCTKVNRYALSGGPVKMNAEGSHVEMTEDDGMEATSSGEILVMMLA